TISRLPFVGQGQNFTDGAIFENSQVRLSPKLRHLSGCSLGRWKALVAFLRPYLVRQDRTNRSRDMAIYAKLKKNV
ncbi:hypothetical protein V1477_006249, partial [Vespula maculifrons]